MCEKSVNGQTSFFFSLALTPPALHLDLAIQKFVMQTTPVVYSSPSKTVDIHINYEHIRFLTGGLRWQTSLRLGRLMLMVV